jgi:hypothetical protein
VTTSACNAPAGYVADNTDCDDNNPGVNPGATEVCNALDDDCDTQVDEGVQTTFYQDADTDTYGNPAVTTSACNAPAGYVADNTDCDDNNPGVNPGATEVCNSIDDDCNGSPEGSSNTWNGNGDGINWSDAANWSDGMVPLTCQDVIIPAGFQVIVPINFNAVGKTLDVPFSGQIEVQGTMIIQQ